MIGHEFPYLDTRDLNLDWILRNIKKLLSEWAEKTEENNKKFDSIDAAIADLWDYLHDLDVQDAVNNIIQELIAEDRFSYLVEQSLGYTRPEWYGADGTGDNDDTEYFSDCLATGLPILIDNTYTVSNLVIDENFHKFFGTGTIKLIAETGYYGIFAPRANIEFSGITFVGGAATRSDIHTDAVILDDGGALIKVGSRTSQTTSEGAAFNDCKFYRTDYEDYNNLSIYGSFIHITNMHSFEFKNCYAEYAGELIRGASSLYETGGAHTNINKVVISDNKAFIMETSMYAPFVNMDNTGANDANKYYYDSVIVENNIVINKDKNTLSPQKPYGIGYVKNFIFCNNIAYNTNGLIDCDNPLYGALKNNKLINEENRSSYGIRIGSDSSYGTVHVNKNVDVSGNNIVKASTAFTGNSAHNLDIHGNIISDCDIGIYFFGLNDSSVHDNIMDTVRVGFDIRNWTNVKIHDNNISIIDDGSAFALQNTNTDLYIEDNIVHNETKYFLLNGTAALPASFKNNIGLNDLMLDSQYHISRFAENKVGFFDRINGYNTAGYTSQLTSGQMRYDYPEVTVVANNVTNYALLARYILIANTTANTTTRLDMNYAQYPKIPFLFTVINVSASQQIFQLTDLSYQGITIPYQSKVLAAGESVTFLLYNSAIREV